MTDQPSPLPPQDPMSPPRAGFFEKIHPIPFALLALALVFLLYQGIGTLAVLVATGGKIAGESTSLLRWLTLGGQLLLMLVPTVLLARLRYGKIRTSLRLTFPEPLEILVIVVAVFALQQVLQGYMTMQDALPLPEPLRRIADLFRNAVETSYRLLAQASHPGEFVFVVITVALVPAVCEEFLFRGLVQGSLEESFGGIRAAVVTGVIFGMYHLNPFGIVPLVALGVFFGYVVFRSGSLLLAITAHFFNNFVACTALYLRYDDDFIVLQPHGGASAGMVFANVLFFLLVFAGATYYFTVLTRKEGSRPASQ
jgi:membrane protease YdiL (CAAX protease family)